MTLRTDAVTGRCRRVSRFDAALRKTDDGDPDVAIEPVGDAPEPNRTPRRGPPAGAQQRSYARR